jgi:hypothetical protein
MTLIKWLIAVGVLVTLALLVAFGSWISYSRRFSEIDHAGDSLRTNGSPSDASLNESGDYSQRRVETTYQNARSGVSLKLPGVWRDVNASSILKPDVAHRFCVLRSQGGLFVMFWPIFPDFRPSLDADARAMSAQFTGGGFILKNQRTLFVRGRTAVALKFKAPDGKVDMNLLVIRRGPALCLAAISGSEQRDPSWKQVEDSLPESIEIQ